MLAHRLQVTWVALFLASLGSPESGWADSPSQASKSRIEAALQNVMTLERPGQDGFATIWDGNKYVQCGRLRDRGLKCEAAGSLMQPSLDHVLTPERVSRLAALGWRLDPSFGNYVQTFPADIAASVLSTCRLATSASYASASTCKILSASTLAAISAGNVCTFLPILGSRRQPSAASRLTRSGVST